MAEQESLSPQLGTDPIDLEMGRVDMRRLTVLKGNKMGAVLYAAVRAKNSPSWATVLDWYLNMSVGIGGRGRRDIIRMEQVSRGGSVNVEAEIEAQKPAGWVERNLTRRNWKQEALEEMGESEV
jgi:hypothetical protein